MPLVERSERGVTEGDLRRFTEGDCHYLARAIHQRTGWPMHAFVYDDEPDLHAFVVMPDGRALDVHGAACMDAFRARWDDHAAYEQFSWADFKRAGWLLPEYGAYTYRRAHIVAERLLKGVENRAA